MDVLFVVREAGVEPARPCEHWHLKPASLPIPPLARGLELRFVQRGIYNSIGKWECQGVFQKSFPLKFNPAFLRSGGSRRSRDTEGEERACSRDSVPQKKRRGSQKRELHRPAGRAGAGGPPQSIRKRGQRGSDRRGLSRGSSGDAGSGHS